jgi:MFS family permease
LNNLTLPKSITQELLRIPVLVAALGYMVDMYDLFLFSIVRIPSLKSLNISGEKILEDGLLLLNLQMAGLLIGGVFWGILGDKKGRLSVLFGSILIYSLANIGNGFVTSLSAYAVLRFIAGFGLAGELGAGITLVTEILPNKIRGYGSTLVATMGVFGVLLAFLVSYLFEWRASYFIGGGLGLFLMISRIKVFESGIFLKLKDKNIKRGDNRMLFNNKTRLLKYVTSIVIGMPIWFVSGILITFSPEFGKALGLDQPVDAGKVVLVTFAGQVAGNIISGTLSQYLQSRKKVIFLFMIASLLMVIIYLLVPVRDSTLFYILCACLGFCCGYWTLFITVAAELFGSNLRATVATTVPNFVRGTVIPLTFLFLLMKSKVGIIYGAVTVALLTYAIAIVALIYLEETFKKDINYTEDT